MVSFTCDACQDTVTKPRVQTHHGRCRGSWWFSCLDCNEVFDPQTIKQHVQCISEAQRYHGKLYKGLNESQTQKSATQSQTSATASSAASSTPAPAVKTPQPETKTQDSTTTSTEKKRGEKRSTREDKSDNKKVAAEESGEEVEKESKSKKKQRSSSSSSSRESEGPKVIRDKNLAKLVDAVLSERGKRRTKIDKLRKLLVERFDQQLEEQLPSLLEDSETYKLRHGKYVERR